MEIPAKLCMSSGTYCYVVVKASPYTPDSAVFGLNDEETSALVQKFHNSLGGVVNGIMLKANHVQVLNALGLLGYRVVASSGEEEIVWTLERSL